MLCRQNRSDRKKLNSSAHKAIEMRSVVSNHSCEGEVSPSQDTTKPHVGIVEASLLARLEDEEAQIIGMDLIMLFPEVAPGLPRMMMKVGEDYF